MIVGITVNRLSRRGFRPLGLDCARGADYGNWPFSTTNTAFSIGCEGDEGCQKVGFQACSVQGGLQ